MGVQFALLILLVGISPLFFIATVINITMDPIVKWVACSDKPTQELCSSSQLYEAC